MYQKLIKTDSSESNFNELLKAFNQAVMSLDEFDSDNREYDLENQFYAPNHACIWNKVNKIGKKCRIIEKNDKLALVIFEIDNYRISDNNMLLANLYRLEDISAIES